MTEFAAWVKSRISASQYEDMRSNIGNAFTMALNNPQSASYNSLIAIAKGLNVDPLELVLDWGLATRNVTLDQAYALFQESEHGDVDEKEFRNSLKKELYG